MYLINTQRSKILRNNLSEFSVRHCFGCCGYISGPKKKKDQLLAVIGLPYSEGKLQIENEYINKT